MTRNSRVPWNDGKSFTFMSRSSVWLGELTPIVTSVFISIMWVCRESMINSTIRIFMLVSRVWRIQFDWLNGWTSLRTELNAICAKRTIIVYPCGYCECSSIESNRNSTSQIQVREERTRITEYLTISCNWCVLVPSTGFIWSRSCLCESTCHCQWGSWVLAIVGKTWSSWREWS